MADSEERQKFEVASETPDAFEQAWEKYNASGNAGGWEKVAFVKGFGAAWRAAWRAAYEAGEIAMREKAAQRVEKNSCVRHCELCKTSPCGEQSAIMIRALAISGAEESKKEKA